jgi:hypothetical protein
MENGGGGEHRPWMYDEETTDIYRAFVNEHYRLIPYLMTNGKSDVPVCVCLSVYASLSSMYLFTVLS